MSIASARPAIFRRETVVVDVVGKVAAVVVVVVNGAEVATIQTTVRHVMVSRGDGQWPQGWLSRGYPEPSGRRLLRVSDLAQPGSWILCERGAGVTVARSAGGPCSRSNHR